VGLEITVTTIPNQTQEGRISIIAAIIALVPLYALKYFVINPFLAFTSVFPLLFLTQYLGIFGSVWVPTLSFLTQMLLHKTVEEAGNGDLVALFFICTFALGVMIDLIQRGLKHIGMVFKIRMVHVMFFMSVLYALAWLVTHKDPDGPGLFLLVGYLFNLYSIFSYHIIGVALRKLSDAQPLLRAWIS